MIPIHLFHAFSTFAVGGQQTRFVNLANALGDKYRHTILAMDNNHEAAAGLDAKVRCAFERMPVVKSRGVSLANLIAMRAMLKRLRPDVLCTYNWGAIEWSVANWLFPLASQIHIEDGFGPDESPDRQHFRRSAMRRLSLSRCARIVVPSTVLHDVTIRKWHLPPERVLYLPNGIDCERFAQAPDAGLLSSLGLASGDLVVGTVAALRAEKNLDRLLRVFAQADLGDKAKLLIVGDGPERAALLRTATDLGISGRMVMTGAMPSPERVLGRFDIFALSSDTEQMPNSILEAMAAGLAVLATDVGDVKQMLAPENALFVHPRDDLPALIGGLRTLAGDGAARKRIGGSNRSRVRTEYSLDAMVSRYDALFAAAARSRDC